MWLLKVLHIASLVAGICLNTPLRPGDSNSTYNMLPDSGMKGTYTMLVRIAAIAAISLLVPLGTASHAGAEPDTPPPAPGPAEGVATPPPPEGAIPSAEPSLLAT